MRISAHFGYIFGYSESNNPSSYYHYKDLFGYYTFEIPKSIKQVIISDGITEIDSDDFFYSPGITSVVIPKSIKTIEEKAFYKCGSLSKVYYVGTEEEWEDVFINLFYNDDFVNAEWYFYSETKPEKEGAFWHYDTYGNVIEWDNQE